MKKVVINSAFGGFNVSADALYLLLMLGFPLEKYTLEDAYMDEASFSLEGPNGVRANSWGNALLKDGYVYRFEQDASHSPEAAALRSHPVLVKVVEMLGARANGSCCKLVIKTVDSNALYCIDEYDGKESVHLLDASEYTAGFEYVEPALPPEMQISGSFKRLSN